MTGLSLLRNIAILGHQRGVDAGGRSLFGRGTWVPPLTGYDENETTIECASDLNVCITFSGQRLEVDGISFDSKSNLGHDPPNTFGEFHYFYLPRNRL